MYGGSAEDVATLAGVTQLAAAVLKGGETLTSMLSLSCHLTGTLFVCGVVNGRELLEHVLHVVDV